MNKFTVPDICDEFEDKIQIGDLFLNSYGQNEKFFGEVQTARCEHSNKVVKELVSKSSATPTSPTPVDLSVFFGKVFFA